MSNCVVPNRACAWRPVWVVLASLVLASCGGSGYDGNGNVGKPIKTGFLRIANALPDSPTLLAGLDGATLTRVSFAQATQLQQLASGKYAINVQYIDPNAVTVTLINKEQTTVEPDEQSTVFIVGTLNDRHSKTVVNPLPAITAGNAEVQVMQTVASQPSLDVYLTDAAADIATTPKLTTLAFDQASELTTVAAGTNYRLRVTAAGSTTVLYDSGVFPIADMARVMFVVVDYFGPGGAGFRVVQLNNQNATNFPSEVLPVAFRVANMIADVPSADLYVGPVAGTPAFAGIAFGSVAPLQQFPAGTLACTLTVAGDPATVLFTGDVSLSPGETRTLVLAKGVGAASSRVTIDNTRPISSEGQLQIVNAAPSSTPTDMFLILPGKSTTDTTASVVNQPLLSIAGSIAAAATYDVAFTATATTAPIAGPDPLAIVNGGIYTVYVTDAAGGGAPFQIVVSTF